MEDEPVRDMNEVKPQNFSEIELKERFLFCSRKSVMRTRLKNAYSSKRPVVVQFMTFWCPASLDMYRLVQKLAKKRDDVNFIFVNAEVAKGLVKEGGVERVPTFLFLKEGRDVDMLVGGQKLAFRDKFLRLTGTQ